MIYRYIIDQDSFYTITREQIGKEPKWKLVHDRINASVEKLWRSIRDVLSADAPEGHVPEDLEEENSLDTKEILSYSWRALKEARSGMPGSTDLAS
jgi:hypothetical protein